MSDLVIRVDASTEIGTGHLMRCLALAQAWRDRGGTTTFVCAALPKNLAVRVESEGFALVRVTGHPGSADDSRQVIKLARMRAAQWIVVDGYHFGLDYHCALKDSGMRLLVLDDYGHVEHYVADLVLNQNAHADMTRYGHRERDTRLLLGTQYTLLRREFLAWQTWTPQPSPVIRHILVTLGGSDSGNVTKKVLTALRWTQLTDFKVTVLVGGSNPHADALAALVKEMPVPTTLLRNVTHMPDLLAQIDLAISAAGSTCWELAYMGVPSLVLMTAANQRSVVDSLKYYDAAVVLGWHDEVTRSLLTNQFDDLAQDAERRERFSQRGYALVDGAGADRICAILVGAPSMRPAVWDDAVLLWEWANDPLVRRNSFHPELIPYESHLQWYRSKLASPATRIWIAEVDEKPVGQIRYDRVDASSAEIDLSVAPAFRGCGLGTEMVRRTWRLACRALAIDWVKGMVRFSNPASKRTFEKTGFTLQSQIKIEGYDCFIFARRREIPVARQTEPDLTSKWMYT